MTGVGVGGGRSGTGTVGAPAGGWTSPSATDRLRMLRESRTVAVVGASDNPSRASYFVATYLLASSP